MIAPSLVPTKAGDRVKTDRRDAEKLARCYRAGELTAVWVPDASHEALRDLVRAREAAKKDQLKARHRLGKFLLRHGRRPEGIKAWTQKHREWINSHVHFDQPALEATLADYLEEMDHAAARFVKLEVALDEAAQRALSEIRAVLRGGNTSLARAAQPKTKGRLSSWRIKPARKPTHQNTWVLTGCSISEGELQPKLYVAGASRPDDRITGLDVGCGAPAAKNTRGTGVKLSTIARR